MKKVGAFLVLAIAALALVACGSSSDSSSSTTETSGGESQAEQGGGAQEEAGGVGSSASTLKFEADPGGNLAYTTTQMTAKPGKVTIDFDNPQALDHNVVLENSKGEEIARTELVADGSESTTADLKPGTYQYYCSVPGHREAGMEGTLVVK